MEDYTRARIQGTILTRLNYTAKQDTFQRLKLRGDAVQHSSTKLQRMRKAFYSAGCARYADLHEKNLTSEQQHVYTTVFNSVRTKDGKAYIIDARAGTGKTYTQTCIASRLRGENRVVLIVDSTGIAALNFLAVGSPILCSSCQWMIDTFVRMQHKHTNSEGRYDKKCRSDNLG